MSISQNYPATRPSLNLNFARSRSLDPRITFTRASTATYVGSDGLIKTAAVNEPRFDHNPTTGESLGLLVEEARTNSIRNNTGVGAVAGTPGTLPTTWFAYVSSGTGVSTSIISTGTDSGVNYVDIRFNGTPSVNAVWSVVTELTGTIPAATGQVWTYSAWIKIASGSNSNVSNPVLFFDEIVGSTFVTGLSISTSFLTSRLDRYSATYTLNGGATVNRVNAGIRFAVTSGQAIDITLRIGLPQLEQGAFPTSVIPTTTATATRSADVAQITGTNFSTWYNPTEGTLFAAARVNFLEGPQFPGLAYVDDGTINNSLGIYINDAVNDFVAVEAYISNVNQYALFSSSVATANQLVRAITAYKANDFAAAFNIGTSTVGTGTSGSIPVVDRLRIGALRGGAMLLNGTVAQISYYPARLTNTQLQSIVK